MKVISSSQNAQFKYWKSLCESKGLKKSNHFIVSGRKLIEEVLSDSDWKSQVEIIIEDESETFSTSPVFTEFERILLSKSLFQELDILGTKSPLLIVQKPKIKTWDSSIKLKGLSLLCPLGDPQNLGAIVRSAYAFGVTSVILLKEAANPFLPKAIKASSGAILKMPFYNGPSINEFCKKEGNQKSQNKTSSFVQSNIIYALDLNGPSLLSIKQWPDSFYLLLGEEGPGVPEKFEGKRVSIPMRNPMESLNVAVAAGIAMFQMCSR